MPAPSVQGTPRGLSSRAAGSVSAAAGAGCRRCSRADRRTMDGGRERREGGGMDAACARGMFANAAFVAAFLLAGLPALIRGARPVPPREFILPGRAPEPAGARPFMAGRFVDGERLTHSVHAPAAEDIGGGALRSAAVGCSRTEPGALDRRQSGSDADCSIDPGCHCVPLGTVAVSANGFAHIIAARSARRDRRGDAPGVRAHKLFG